MPKAAHTLIHSSESKEWYTPAAPVEIARAVMGGIDCDPASCEEANRTIRAGTYYTRETNGLTSPWFGRVWLNCPYGYEGGTCKARGCDEGRIDGMDPYRMRDCDKCEGTGWNEKAGRSNVEIWSTKLIEVHKSKQIEQAFTILNATPDSGWFKPLWQFPLIFGDKRTRFLGPDGAEPKQPTHGNVLVWLPPEPYAPNDRALDLFYELGKAWGQVILPINGFPRASYSWSMPKFGGIRIIGGPEKQNQGGAGGAESGANQAGDDDPLDAGPIPV